MLPYFLLDQKVTKNQGFVKMAKNRRAILAERNEVETGPLCFTPGYTNLLSSAEFPRLRFFFLCSLPVFLTPFFQGLSFFKNLFSPIL